MTPETEHLQPDKLFDHHRQQLSAMMDGALAPDQARFLLRRLQHDTDLTACWERWQVCGDVLRGHADALLPRDFALRVATAVASEAAAVMPATAASRSRWVRWGGGAALAASVAVAALLVLRQTPNTDAEFASDPAQVVVAASVAESVAAPASTTPVAAQQTAAPLAVAIAAAEVSRRNTPRRSRGQGQRAAIRNPARAVETSVVAARGAAATTTALATAAIDDAATADPFALRSAAPGRPWPRALLPNAPARGGLTVGLGSSAAAPSFYPFEPLVPTTGATADDRASDDGDVSTDTVVDDPTPR